MKKVLEKLKKKGNKKFAKFQSKIIPTVSEKKILGVKTPDLRKFAKELIDDKDIGKFLNELPHKFFDENQLHAFIISEIKEFKSCLKRVKEFLPFIDNWATCDQLSPKVFKKNKKTLIKEIKKWLKSNKAYVVRFAIGMLMAHFLDEDFDEKYLKWVADAKLTTGKKASRKAAISTYAVDKNPDEYYVEMMRAWYFATALAKQFKEAFPFIKNMKLNPWTHNKTIQKAIESFRIDDKMKKILRKLKV